MPQSAPTEYTARSMLILQKKKRAAKKVSQYAAAKRLAARQGAAAPFAGKKRWGMEYRLEKRGVHLAGAAALAAALVLAAVTPGAAVLRYALAAAFGGYIWVRGLLYVRHARWGVCGGVLFFQTGRLLVARRLLPLGRIGVLHFHRLPLGLCFLTAQAGLAVCVIPFVRRADAEAFFLLWTDAGGTAFSPE